MFDLYILLGLLVLGFGFGKINENRHYRSIEQREQQTLAMPLSNSRYPIRTGVEIQNCKLVTGSVVISVDYFKRMLAGLRAIFGGPVQAYETLVDRARREAVLRLKESCAGADEIINLRIETSSISKGRKNSIGSVEVLAYATALYYGTDQ